MSAFDSINFDTPEGEKLKQRLMDRLQELRERNDDVTLGDRETQANRGAIQEIKKLLQPAAKVVKVQSYYDQQRGDTRG